MNHFTSKGQLIQNTGNILSIHKSSYSNEHLIKKQYTNCTRYYITSCAFKVKVFNKLYQISRDTFDTLTTSSPTSWIPTNMRS